MVVVLVWLGVLMWWWRCDSDVVWVWWCGGDAVAAGGDEVRGVGVVVVIWFGVLVV